MQLDVRGKTFFLVKKSRKSRKHKEICTIVSFSYIYVVHAYFKIGID